MVPARFCAGAMRELNEYMHLEDESFVIVIENFRHTIEFKSILTSLPDYYRKD